MRHIDLNQEWNFHKGKKRMIYEGEIESEIVNLPHDFSIIGKPSASAPGGSATGYFDGGIGTYTKYLAIEETKEAQRYLVEFDGCYGYTTVYLNGNLVGKHHYGYSPFHMDLTPFVRPGGTNKLSVTVDNTAQPNSRWYSGSGIYRHVELLQAGNIHISPWGIFAHTSHVVDTKAFVNVEVLVENHTEREKEVWVRTKLIRELDGKETKEYRKKIHFKPFNKKTIKTQVVVEEVALWDIDNPNLYHIEVKLEDENMVLDQENTLFGIRTITCDTVNGFRLNGKHVDLKGGCIHHDNGILGAASFYDSEYRRMKIHKDSGYNAIRFSHNPMSKELLEACDRLGLIVIDEIFDVWTMEKNPHDYSEHFETNWEKDMIDTMMRDRNHPCICFWSIGNEIPERGRLSNGAQYAYALANKARKMDSTRFIMSSICSFFSGLEDEEQQKFFESVVEELQSGKAGGSNTDCSFGRSIWNEYTESYAASLDIVGYNYLVYQYEEAARRFPDRIICGTESKPAQMEEYWKAVLKYPHVIGDFTWTSYDYLGEAGLGKQAHIMKEQAAKAHTYLYDTPYPWRTSNDADFDICGAIRPQHIYRRIIWGSEETYIVTQNPKYHDMIEVLREWGFSDMEHHWNWKEYEGKACKVEVYSKSEVVELYLNEEFIGTQKAGAENHYKACFDIPYKAGELMAVSKQNGEVVSVDILNTAKEATRILLKPDRTILKANGDSLCFVEIELQDSNGRLVTWMDEKVYATVNGAGTLAALGTGNPVTDECYASGEITLYKGKALAIVRSGMEEGNVLLHIKIGKFEENISMEVRR